METAAKDRPDLPPWLRNLTDPQLAALQSAALMRSAFSIDTVLALSGVAPTIILGLFDELAENQVIVPVPAAKYTFMFRVPGDADLLLDTIPAKDLESCIYTVMSNLEDSRTPPERRAVGCLALLPAIRRLPNFVELLETMIPMLRSSGKPEVVLPVQKELLEALRGRSLDESTKRRLLDAILEYVHLGALTSPPSQLHQLIEEGLTLAGDEADSSALAVLHISAGRLYQKEGNLVQATHHYQEGHAAAGNSSNPRVLNMSTMNFALSLFWQGRMKEATHVYEHNLGSVEELSPDSGNRWAYLMLAYGYGLTGQLSRGIGYATRILELAKQAEHPKTEAWANAILSLIYMEVRQIEAAKPHIERAIELGKRLGDDLTLWMALPCKSYELSEHGEFEKARKLLHAAFQHSSNVTLPHYPAAWLLELLFTLERRGMPIEGFDFDTETRRILSWPDIYMKGVAFRYSAISKRLVGAQPGELIDLLMQSHEHLQTAGTVIELARTQVALAETYLDLNENAEAEKYAAAASRIYTSVDLRDFPFALLPLVSGISPEERILLSMKDLNEANEFLPDLSKYLGAAAACLISMFGTQRAAILRYSPSEGLRIAASRNVPPSEGHELFRGPVGELVLSAIRSRAPIVGEPGSIPEFEHVAGAIAPAIFVACAPMRVGGDVVGAIYMDSRRSSSFSASSVALLESTAAHIALAIHASLLREELDGLRVSLRGESGRLGKAETGVFPWIIGTTEAITKAVQLVETVAPTDANVLILGETGVGKELFAKAIHSASKRSGKPFVAVNVGALPENLVESELFGFEKGAFTGATHAKPGRFELANGGTIFLDEIGELPHDTQVKLLRVLQERAFERIGGTTTINTDYRLVAATNRDLLKHVQKGSFRADLYYRLRTVVIEIPPLRKRKEDIPLLARHFISTYSNRHKKDVRFIPEDDMRRLVQHSWPGNVRELAAVVESGIILSEGAQLVVPDLDVVGDMPPTVGRDAPDNQGGMSALTDVEREHILAVLNSTKWRIRGAGGAAQILRLKPTTLEYRMKKLGISRA